MGSKLNPDGLRLYRVVDEVLHYVRDPIGVSRFPEARDEYHAYLPQVFGLVQEASDEHEIADFLGTIVTARMGLAPRPDADLQVARLLLAWAASIRRDPLTEIS